MVYSSFYGLMVLMLRVRLYLVISAWASYFDAAAGKTHSMDKQLLAVFSDSKWFDFGVSFS